MSIPKKTIFISIASLLVLAVMGYVVFRYIEHREYVKASPYDVLISDISGESVTISWKTDIEEKTYLKIGENEKLWGNGDLTKSHRVTLSGLKESSVYSFIISDGKRDWENTQLTNSNELSNLVTSQFQFQTVENIDYIALPLAKDMKALPNELVYLALYNSETKEYSDVKSVYANRFGGLVIDERTFNKYIEDANVELVNIGYFTAENSHLSSRNAVYADEINCNQSVSAQSFDGLSKEKFTDLATRWVAGRGKNYASECYNDVILRAKKAGVDPGFALTIWLNESGASNYTQNMSINGLVEDFGIHGIPSVPTQDFNSQITHFLSLSHNPSCPGLTKWEAWGNNYLWGSCNENDPVKRQQGIDYYKGIETVYGWVTNGRSLPGQVTGLPKSGGDDDGGQDTTKGPLCCALKIDNKEELQGDFENNAEGKTCDDVWAVGRSVYGGKIEYSVEIPDKVGSACEVKYQGVCCQLQDDIKWYPKVACSKVIDGVGSSQACKDYANNRACFFREGSYQWLPKSIANDYLKEVTTEAQCNARNKLSTYKLTLVEGVNFVGFDFSPTYKASAMYASNLMEISPNIMLIGNFEGYAWKDIISQSEGLPFAGNDFYFEQNKGYLIIASKDTVLELDGWKDSSATYKPISNGWNLVGGSVYTKSYKASTLISNLKKNNIDVDTVGIWSNDLANFTYRREEEGGDIYGDDLKLVTNQGIFLKK